MLAQSDNKVILFHHSEQFIAKLRESGHPNLSHLKLHQNINITSEINMVNDSSYIFIAVPTNSLSSILSKLDINENSNIILLCKGIDIENYLLPSQILKRNSSVNDENICVLSGPSHAEEVIKNIPTTVVVASKNMTLNRKIQELMSSSSFRVYSNSDIVGVEVSGATKNVISIASGICIGLGFGDNTTAALITRGINEIQRLGSYFGAEESTFYGLAGIGDLSVTAFSKHSRNRGYGIKVGKGSTPDEALKEMDMVVEGYYTTSAINEIITREKIDMPISSSVYGVLFEGLSPRQAIMDLMNRDLTHENN